jgi:hypothetical protein
MIELILIGSAHGSLMAAHKFKLVGEICWDHRVIRLNGTHTHVFEFGASAKWCLYKPHPQKILLATA